MSLCTGSDVLNEMAEKPVNTVVGQHVVVKSLTKNCLKTTEFHAIFQARHGDDTLKLRHNI